jgi:hypothetical protein
MLHALWLPEKTIRQGQVGPRHTIDEPDEQGRAIFGGAWGETGAAQGEHCFKPTPTRHSGIQCSMD